MLSTLRGIPGSHDFKPQTVLTPAGTVIASCLSAIKETFPTVRILRHVIMPEHLHFVLFNTEPTDYNLGNIICYFKSECTRNILDAGLMNERSLSDPFFEKGYHDRILLKRGQLRRMLTYVSDNPRRRLERLACPSFFSRHRLKGPDGVLYEAYGNRYLLEDPDIEPVKVSSKYTPQQLQDRKVCWLHTVQNGGVLVSPFISRAEHNVLDWAIDNGGRLILVTGNGFGPNYAPKGRLHTLCAEGRLLLIAPAVYSTSAVPTTRAACLSMNALAEAIAAYSLRPC